MQAVSVPKAGMYTRPMLPDSLTICRHQASVCRAARTSKIYAQAGSEAGGGEKFIYAGDVLEEVLCSSHVLPGPLAAATCSTFKSLGASQARRMSSDFIFEDNGEDPVWEHDERLASNANSSRCSSECMDNIILVNHTSLMAL